jgi:hypothetical protein
MNEAIINGLAVIGAVSCVIWLVKGIKSLIAKAQETSPEIAAAPVLPSSGDLAAITAVIYAIVGPHRIVEIEAMEPANDDIAAISAAIHVMMGTPHRIVHIENTNRAQAWVADGRWMHQTSHRPH